MLEWTIVKPIGTQDWSVYRRWFLFGIIIFVNFQFT